MFAGWHGDYRLRTHDGRMVERYGGKVETMPSLSIKNEEACRLIRELATLRGESMTAVVIHAAKEALERERKLETSRARVDHWLKVGQELRAAAGPDGLARDHIAELYDDETGLPK